MLFFGAFEAALLALSLSVDAFAVAFAYGCKRIQLPRLSAQVINGICTGITGLSFLVGSALEPFIPGWFAVGLSFTILLLIGITKLMDSITKSIIRKHTDINKEIKLSMFNFKFILRLYAEPEAADVDVSECISPKEAAVLAVSLSLDGFAVGFGAALLGFNGWAVVLFSLLANGLALRMGSFMGNKAVRCLPFDITWTTGVVLIGLALTHLL